MLSKETIQIIEAASNKQSKAKTYLKEDQYAKAIVLLEEVLSTKMKYRAIEPFISIVDIADISYDLSVAFVEEFDFPSAWMYALDAWSIYHEELGVDHPLTMKAEIKAQEAYFLKIFFVDESPTRESAAAA